MKQINLIDGRVCIDHIHMYIAIPPKISVSEFMSYLKGKSAIMLFDRHPEYRNKWGDRHFWARGYYVSTVGNVNEETILKYIKEQEENDKLADGRKQKSLLQEATNKNGTAKPRPWRNLRNTPEGLKLNPHLKWGLLTKGNNN